MLLTTRRSVSAEPLSDDHQIAFRQLRHLTRNALQSAIGSVHCIPELANTEQGRLVTDAVERALCASAAISDALFGLTRAPAPLPQRLRSLCASIVMLHSNPDQTISVETLVEGECPPAYEDVVMKIAHELVGNAIKHGIRASSHGHVTIRLMSDQFGRTNLAITDSGCGLVSATGEPGEGLKLARELAAPHSGRVWLCCGPVTRAELLLPAPRMSAPMAREQGGLAARFRRLVTWLKCYDVVQTGDLAVISAAALVFLLSMIAVDRLILTSSPIRSLCIGHPLLGGVSCEDTRDTVGWAPHSSDWLGGAQPQTRRK